MLTYKKPKKVNITGFKTVRSINSHIKLNYHLLKVGGLAYFSADD
jgi:hypothetical protein